MLSEILSWATIAAAAAIVTRFPPSGFWSLGVARPFVLARVRPDGPSRSRQTAD